MSYDNFKQTFWSKHIQTENAKFMVFSKLCDYKFEGEATHGEKVKILGVARPTIGNFTGASIGAPETVQDTSAFLEIDQAKYFNFMVGDIDKAQGKEGLMQALTKESSIGLAEARDAFIAKTGADGAGTKSAAAAISTSAAMKAAVDAAFVALWNNGVKFTDDVFIVLAPWAYSLFQSEMIELKTENDDLISKGIVGMYNNAKVYMSNNLSKSSTNDVMLIGTTKAMAFASQVEKVIPFIPDGQFADALKGLDVYGAKVVRPKELYALVARKGS